MKRELTVLALLVSALCLSTESLAKTEQGSDVYGNSTYGFGSGYGDPKLQEQVDAKAERNARAKVYMRNGPQMLRDYSAKQRVEQEAYRLSLAEDYLAENKAHLSAESRREVEMYIEESRNKLQALKDARKAERKKVIEREFRNKDDVARMTEVEKKKLYKRYGLSMQDYEDLKKPVTTGKQQQSEKPFFSN